MANSEFYSRRGDDGYTGLLGPERVPKYDLRPEAYGTVDETQAALGLARAAGCRPSQAQVLLAVQRDLYTRMAELASAGDPDSPFWDNTLDDWVEGRHIPLPFLRDDVDADAQENLVLAPE